MDNKEIESRNNNYECPELLFLFIKIMFLIYAFMGFFMLHDYLTTVFLPFQQIISNFENPIIQ